MSGVSSVVAAGSMPYWAGIAVRVVTYGSVFAFLANDQFLSFPVTLTGGYPGVGAWGDTGGAIAAVQVGPRCLTAPNPISAGNVANSAYPTSVSLNWAETAQPADVQAVGIPEWYTARDGGWYGQITEIGAWADPNVTPGSTHSYAIAPVTFHGASAPYSSPLSVITPSALNVDPVRTGVKPLGTYWGSAPENIDVASGNLNLTIPLVRPQGRGGWSVPIALTYNSQIWKQDSAGIQNMGRDVGYGYGWKMLAGSLTPYWNQAVAQVDHYLYIDATGGQYRLYPSGTANLWVSHLYPVASGLSGESIYVYYDSSTNLLHFRDGSSWLMGCMSSGEEQDAGTLYPTLLEDRNGNQVIITYGAGIGTSLYATSPTAIAINSSARIVSIEDTRATGTAPSRSTYNFNWTGPDGNGVPHLASITNNIGTSEAYSFTMVPGLNFADPWQGTVPVPNLTGLSKVTNTPLNTSYYFVTDNAGEMLELQLPYGGYLRWSYGINLYTWSSPSNQIKLNAVTGRYLAAASTASAAANSGGAVTEWAYPITYTPAPSNESVVAGSCVGDTGAASKRCWSFVNGASTGIPVTMDAQRWGTVGGTITELRDEALTYTHDAAGNPVVIQNLATDFTGASGNVYSMTQQAADAFGNTTQVSTWDYSTNVPSGAASRVVNMTYKNNCASAWTGSTANDCPYVNAFMLSLPLATSLTAGSTTALASNTYDAYTKYSLVNLSGLQEYDNAYANPFVTIRGNVTQSVKPGSVTNSEYDVTGMTLAADDNQGHAVSIAAATGTNNSAPGTIQPNTGQSMDSSLATALSYSPFLAVNATTGPNGAGTTLSYDAAGRPLSGVSATGATTTYTYAFGTTVGGTIANGPFTTTATTNGHWTTAVADGLGRPVRQTSGFGTTPPTTVSVVDTVYGPCACSPNGKMVKSSQPYTVAANEVWTSYTYDGLGRTLTVALPDGASQTKYTYQGNWTTVVDPAGKWKQYHSDVFGNLVNVVEPDPNATPPLAQSTVPPSTSEAKTLVTTYTYNGLSHLTQASMPRGSVAQTRTWTYDPITLKLTGTTSPETGTTSYTYNADGTLATRVDAKNQITAYSYDGYQRLSKVTHGSDSTQTVTYLYDTDPLNAGFATNAAGRLAAIEVGACGSGPMYAEEYAYTVAGQVSAKQVSLVPKSSQGCQLVGMVGRFSYDSEGKVTSVTYPSGSALGQKPGLAFQYSYDSAGRPAGLTDTENATSIGGCSPAPPAWNGAVTWASNATYNPAGQMVGLQRLSSVTPTCNGTVVGSFNQAWQYSAMNQLTEIDTSTQQNGYPVGSATPGAASSFFERYHFSATQNNGQITQVDDARLGYSVGYTYDALKRLSTATAGMSGRRHPLPGPRAILTTGSGT